ncbi:MAG: nickel pincer cofactor biosynthesis protein LarC [Negativicutes bacterium]|nr:nickel pincer cofactor biosynthesis protein LarC [Negativicutes bacterium]
MKTICVEAFSGISGNMFLGAMLNLGVPVSYITDELAKMHLGAYEIVCHPVNKCGIAATYFNVLLPEEHEHNHEHEPSHENAHNHEHHHAHGQAHEHDHAQHHINHQAIADKGHHDHVHRNLSDIISIINKSGLSTAVKEKSIQIFNVLAHAEARVHGKPLEEVHFHEVGAIDTIIDIVGSVLALDYLGVEHVFVNKIQTGCGFIQCAHGLMPVPAPATAEILKQLPHYHGQIEKELVTPTGAALMAALAKPMEDFPERFFCERIGYGAGTWDLAIPNVVRLNLGEIEEKQTADSLLVLECNIDDMPGEIYPYVIEKLLANGALDAWIAPIIMKKGRPAHKLSVLVSSDILDLIVEMIMRETSSLGVRYYPVKRKIAVRKFVNAEFDDGLVAVKIAKYNNEIINIAPEYEDCSKIAKKSGKSLKNIMHEAWQKAEAMLDE